MVKKILIAVLCFGLLILVSVLSYYNTNYYIRQQWWKGVDGLRSTGDFMKFKEPRLTIVGRTIFKNGKPVATLVFCWGKELTIRDMKTGVSGQYTNKYYWL